jgi:hypothetical protein
MGKMHIAVDAKSGDIKCAFKFRWEGDDAAIRDLMSRIEKEAASIGVTAQQFTDSCVKQLPATGLRENENEQQSQIAAIAYTILKLPIEGSGGLVCDYVATDGDIQAEVFIADGDFRVEVTTPTGKDWIETLDWDEAHEALALLEREGDDLVPDSAELVKAVKERLGRLVREELHGHPELFVQLPDGRWWLTKEGKRVAKMTEKQLRKKKQSRANAVPASRS